jgi:peptidylprolyl isomerase
MFTKELDEQFHLPPFPLLYTADWLCSLRYGWSFREASALEQVAKCRLPMLFIHGDADAYVPTWMFHPLFENKPQPKEGWIVPGATHGLSYKMYPEEYTARVKQFTDKYMTNETQLKIETTAGDIVVKLYNETPLHRDNFIKLAQEGTYEGTLFHRVIRDFMIQAGDPDSKNAPAGAALGSGDVGYTVPAEFAYPKRFHHKGVLAAARQGDAVNPEKASSGCQFYIVTGKVFDLNALMEMEARIGHSFTDEQIEAYTTVGGTPHLDGSYTVFGEVTRGMEVVDSIQRVPTDGRDRPLQDVRILKVTLLDE